ncbi:MAG TPA: recombinase family protein [Pseudonocardiaceae bacterium]|jgi:DNA invertase Pin-like site-specific DNA recombinase|nr:recombinase family protein [Pseudonocardiaceae bacterium]
MVGNPEHPGDILNPARRGLTYRHREPLTPQEVLAGLNTPAAAATGILTACFVGRTSTDDKQDPTLSLPRQLGTCQKALAGVPEDVVIVAHFYDVESGRKDLDQRGRGTAHEQFAIPIHRDGGIADMLTEAASPRRRFDLVICESIDRIGRRTVYATRIEHELQRHGVRLLAADEPIDLARGANPRATNVLTRRVKQGISEWYVLEMLEKSRGGFEQHTEAGFNIGQAPYGYLAEKIPHPVPARRAEGRSKTRLAPDPDRAPVVEQIYSWRIDEKLGYRAIAERLNHDPDRYPPPVPPDPARALGAWSGSSVRDILHNPKYTGYQVWNRRASKDPIHPGKYNPTSEWVWSKQPTHPAIISLDTFKAALDVAPKRARSRSDANPGAPNPHRQTENIYRLRSYIVCELCGKRMFGKTRKTRTYYYCQPRGPRQPEGHPPTIWLPEPDLLAATTTFFNTHVFGPNRQELLAASVTTADLDQARAHHEKIDAVRRTIDDLELRQERLLRTLEERDDPTGAVFDRLQQRLTSLASDHRTKLAELSQLQNAAQARPVNAVDLIQYLPETTLDLADMPHHLLRQLCDAFTLRVTYNKHTHQADFNVDIAAHTIPRIQQLAIPSTTEAAGTHGQFCDEPRRGRRTADQACHSRATAHWITVVAAASPRRGARTTL